MFVDGVWVIMDPTWGSNNKYYSADSIVTEPHSDDYFDPPFDWFSETHLFWTDYSFGEREYTLTIDNHTQNATVKNISDGGKYYGDIPFTVRCLDACVVAISTDGGETYTRLQPSGTGDTRSFTLPMYADTKLFIALKGDATLDGRVNATDATQIKRYAVKIRIFGPESMLAADVTLDGKVNSTDATQVKRFAVKLRTFEW